MPLLATDINRGSALSSDIRLGERLYDPFYRIVHPAERRRAVPPENWNYPVQAALRM
jgi:hypothetical protein